MPAVELCAAHLAALSGWPCLPRHWHPANICCSSAPPHPALLLLLLHVHACSTDSASSSTAKVRLNIFQLFSLLQGLQRRMLLLLLGLAAAQAAAAPQLAAVCCSSFKL
jgi:hypothetical protein